MRSLAFVILGLVACTGDTPPDHVNHCTKAIYDLCSSEHDCTSADCRLFNGQFQVCSQACDTTTPCPVDSTGVVGTCESGHCKPSVANDCVTP